MRVSAEDTIKSIGEVVADSERSQAIKLILIGEIVNRYNYWHNVEPDPTPIRGDEQE